MRGTMQIQTSTLKFSETKMNKLSIRGAYMYSRSRYYSLVYIAYMQFAANIILAIRRVAQQDAA